MRINDEEVELGIKRFIHNLIASGMKPEEELPLLFSKIRGAVEEILGRPEHDQTS